MNKIISIVFLFLIFSFNNLNALDFNKKDYQVLKELDIEKSFTHDEHLQDLYNELSNKNHLHIYKRNLKNASIYISKIKEVLNQEGLPSSFLYLSMAESNFKLDARSSTNALGLWQFMPSTAKLYNLKNDEYVDERLDYVKSTHAASKYLNHHHDRFGKWYLAVLAYNCGEGRVIEAITRVSINKYLKVYPNGQNINEIKEYKKVIEKYLRTKSDFYKINKIYKEIKKLNIPLTTSDFLTIQTNVKRQYLPRESRAYLRKIVVLSMVANRNFLKKGYIFNRDINSTLTTVKVKGGLHLRNIANVIDMDFKSLSNMNLHIKQDIIPANTKNYDLNIPYSKLEIYNKNKNKIKNDTFAIYYVKDGDTLSRIGAKFNVKYSFIKDFNDLKSDKLIFKQKLIIPILKNRRKKATTKVETVKNKKLKEIIYVVESTDTLGGIAYKFNVNIEKLKKDNKLKSDNIKVGDKIAIYK